MNTQVTFSQDIRIAMTLAYINHWRFRVIGYGEVPTGRIYNGDWYFEPTTEAPPAAQERLKVLKMAGINFKGMVVAHEVMKWVVKEPEEKQKQDFKIDSSGILPALGEAVVVIGKGMFLLMALVMAGIDPALIVILEDGTWLEVMTWYE